MEAKREAIAKAEEETGETEEEVANAHAAAFTAVEKLEKSALRPKAKKITDVVQQKTIKKSLRVSVSFEVSASGRTILDKVLEIICISRCRGLWRSGMNKAERSIQTAEGPTARTGTAAHFRDPCAQRARKIDILIICVDPAPRPCQATPRHATPRTHAPYTQPYARAQTHTNTHTHTRTHTTLHTSSCATTNGMVMR